MELYRVTLEYEDVDALREYERKLAAVARSAGREFSQQPPRRKRAVKQVAVTPGYGGDPCGRAADLAVRSVVGDPKCWSEFMPLVLVVEHEGSVAVEEALKG